MQLGIPLAVVGVGMLVWQWANAPVSIPSNGRVADETQVRKWEDAENETKQIEYDASAAGKVFASFGCANGRDLALRAGFYARKNRISPRLVAATIVAESSCRASIVSKDGAIGLLQIDRHTWRTYSRTELLNPTRNVEVGTLILARYVREGGSNREGLRRYFGITPGSDQADLYADKVLQIARMN